MILAVCSTAARKSAVCITKQGSRKLQCNTCTWCQTHEPHYQTARQVLLDVHLPLNLPRQFEAQKHTLDVRRRTRQNGQKTAQPDRRLCTCCVTMMEGKSIAWYHQHIYLNGGQRPHL
jgi:hypothetical protein